MTFSRLWMPILGCTKINRARLFFFDEIQNISGWEKFARRINDQGYRVFLAGSNSRLLSREIATESKGF